MRGAPAIGVAAAYGAWLGAREKNPQSPQELERALGETCAYLKTSRPTAVNLAWALSRMEKCLATCPHEWDVSARLDALLPVSYTHLTAAEMEVQGVKTPGHIDKIGPGRAHRAQGCLLYTSCRTVWEKRQIGRCRS